MVNKPMYSLPSQAFRFAPIFPKIWRVSLYKVAWEKRGGNPGMAAANRSVAAGFKWCRARMLVTSELETLFNGYVVGLKKAPEPGEENNQASQHMI